jgi:hypothetical protein
MPNPIARRILGETSLDPEKTDMYASLIGLRDGGMPGFRPLGYASGGDLDQSDLGGISTADAPRRATAEEMEDARRIETMSMLRFYLGDAEGRKDLPPYWKSLSANTLNELFQQWQKDPEAARKTWEGLSAEMREMKEGADAGGAGMMAPMAPMPADTGEEIGAVGMPSPWNMGFVADSTVSRGPLEYVDPGPWYETGGRLEDVPVPTAPTGTPIPTEEVVGMTSFRPKGSTLDEMGSMFDLYRDGGYVKQKYAYGGSVPHGTVAGELPRYGDMSVREEGESMRELAKRHKDQRWYNRMGGGLGSLMRRA